MARTALEYLRLLQSLLPRGRAWNRDDDSTLGEFLYGEAEEFARVDGRSDDLLDERGILTSDELLTDHERDLGLPECFPLESTVELRKARALAKLVLHGKQNKQHFIDLIEEVTGGYIIRITEYTPFWCGMGVSGDPCGDQETIFYWKVASNYGWEWLYFTCGESHCYDHLIEAPSGFDGIICLINRRKQAHTQTIFAYEADFSEAFNSDYNSISHEPVDYLYGAFDKSFSYFFERQVDAAFDEGFDPGFDARLYSELYRSFDVLIGGGFESGAFRDGFRKPSYLLSKGPFCRGFSIDFSIFYQ